MEVEIPITILRALTSHVAQQWIDRQMGKPIALALNNDELVLLLDWLEYSMLHARVYEPEPQEDSNG